MGSVNQEITEYLAVIERTAPKTYCDVPDKIQEILEASYEDRLMWGIEQTAQYCFELQKFEMYLKRELNKSNSKVSYVEKYLHKLRGLHAHDWGDKFTKWDEKVCRYEAQDSVCQALQQALLDTQCYINEIKGMAFVLADLCKTLNNIVYIKKGNNESY
jgi:hypothetical protein